jgi:hypothetical protein
VNRPNAEIAWLNPVGVSISSRAQRNHIGYPCAFRAALAFTASRFSTQGFPRNIRTRVVAITQRFEFT